MDSPVIFPPHIVSYTYKDRVQKEITQETLNLFPKDGNKLDVGCSLGATTVELATMFPNSHIYGVDYSDFIISKHGDIFNPNTGISNGSRTRVYDMLKPCNNNYTLQVAQAPDLPFDQSFFNAIIDMNNTYFALRNAILNEGNEIYSESAKEYFEKMSRFLQTGEFFLLAGDCGRHADEEIFEHVVFKKTESGKLKTERTFPQDSRISPTLETIIGYATSF